MQPASAAGLLLAGVSLLLWRTPPQSRRFCAPQVLGATVAIIGLLALGYYFAYWSSGFDPTAQLIEGPLGNLIEPTRRVSLSTSISLTLTGCALCLLNVRTRRGTYPAEWLALAASFAPFTALACYIFGVKWLIKPFAQPLSPSTMALHTAIGILSVNFEILTAYPDRGWLARFTSKTPEGVVARGLMPAAIVMLMGVGVIVEAGRRFQLYSYREELAIAAVLSTLIFGLLIRQCMEALAQLERSRQETEARLQKSEEQLRMALESACIGTWDWNLKTGEVWWSDATADVFGVPPGFFNGRFESFLAFVHPDDRDLVQTQITRSLERAEESYHVEFRIVWPDGTLRHLLARGNIKLDSHGVATRMAGTAMDITDRKLLERELIEASNREQRRLGQDLHDDLCQWLTGIHLESRALSMKLKPKSEADAAHAEKIVSWAGEALLRTRMLVRAMAPAVIATGGLPDALRELAVNAEQMFRVHCRCTCDDDFRVWNLEVALQLYRIAQEALNNALRHSEATEVLLSFGSRVESRAQLVVRDNGRGFPQPRPKTNGMGLRIMQYRAGLIGAHMEIHCLQEGGTEVICTIALAACTGEHKGESDNDTPAFLHHAETV